MANIFNIQQDLFDIFTQIEENEGELTPELEQQLTISQDEFKNKIQSYSNLIRKLEFDIKTIKEEKDRLDTIKKSKEKLAERLKRIVGEAVYNFGDTTKTGTKFIDYGTGKISVRQSESIELADDKLKVFSNRFVNYFNYLRWSNTLNQEILTKDIVDHCNHVQDDNCDDSTIPSFIENDLEYLNADFTVKANFKELLSSESGRNLINSLVNYTSTIDVKPHISKTELKKNLEDNGVLPSFANVVSKSILTIK